MKKTSSKMEIRSDRIRGILEGHALGDSLGSGYEFKSSPRPETFNGVYEHPVNTFNRFQGARNGVLGQITDDFEMTLTLACSLIRNQGFNREDVILSYARWAQGSGTKKGCSFQGKNTRRLFKNKTLRKWAHLEPDEMAFSGNFIQKKLEAVEFRNIKIIYKDYSGYPSYQQLSDPFENFVSIVDLIANVHRDDIANYIWKWRS